MMQKLTWGVIINPGNKFQLLFLLGLLFRYKYQCLQLSSKYHFTIIQPISIIFLIKLRCYYTKFVSTHRFFFFLLIGRDIEKSTGCLICHIYAWLESQYILLFYFLCLLRKTPIIFE